MSIVRQLGARVQLYCRWWGGTKDKSSLLRRRSSLATSLSLTLHTLVGWSKIGWQFLTELDCWKVFLLTVVDRSCLATTLEIIFSTGALRLLDQFREGSRAWWTPIWQMRKLLYCYSISLIRVRSDDPNYDIEGDGDGVCREADSLVPAWLRK